MSNMLVAKNITYKYHESSKRTILEDVDIVCEAGSITLLTGKSGCGKSTLAYILAGLYPENGGVLLSGEVYIDGANIQSLAPSKRVAYVSMMFQNCDLQFCMSNLYQELMLCLENIGASPESLPTEIENAVALLGIEHLLHRNFNTLSGGEKQKCALCCILLLKSKCILLDEAFANVDDQSAKEIIQLIRKTGLTVLAIDHNIQLWEGVYDTRINFDNTPDFVIPNVQKAKHDHNDVVIKTENLSANGIVFPDMTFKKGSITAILGASGCGKTTFFKTLIRQYKYKGNIHFLGRELTKVKKNDLFAQCGIVFQNPANQFLSLTVFDEILFSVKKWNKEKDEHWHDEKTTEWLDAFGFGGYKKYSPYMLSQGQQRRLAVLSMLAGGQGILLLDEPTYGQDYENIYNIMSLLKEKAEKGLTILFSTHNERVAMDFSDAIIRIGEQHV
ncbi:MAG: energy-coupling factor ABC transporter ATP-binding protein [Clostridiales bacterium]|nr:energy-coupling factor ABC transporter ATP-binding protein [Clostridiales bacterium]